jgi:hypothetical protein
MGAGVFNSDYSAAAQNLKIAEPKPCGASNSFTTSLATRSNWIKESCWNLTPIEYIRSFQPLQVFFAKEGKHE